MQTVIGAFDDTATAQRAVESLVQAGFDRDDVHVQHQQQQGAGQMTGMQTETRQQGANWDGQEREVAADKGGVGGFFSSLFGMDDASDRQQNQQMYGQRAYTYDEAVRRGSAVVVVDADDEAQADRAATLLHELGAVDVDERSKQWQAEGWQPPVSGGTQQNLQATGQRDDLRTNQEGVIDVVEEQLQVGKRAVERGGVRVIQRVSSKPVRELVRLREEHAVVERRPVDRPVTGADLSNFKEGTLEVHEMAEEAVVAKTARVVEEVRVGKEVREREETIEDTVRRKDVDIERLSANDRTERAVAADSKTLVNKDKPRL